MDSKKFILLCIMIGITTLAIFLSFFAIDLVVKIGMQTSSLTI